MTMNNERKLRLHLKLLLKIKKLSELIATLTLCVFRCPFISSKFCIFLHSVRRRSTFINCKPVFRQNHVSACPQILALVLLAILILFSSISLSLLVKTQVSNYTCAKCIHFWHDFTITPSSTSRPCSVPPTTINIFC